MGATEPDAAQTAFTDPTGEPPALVWAPAQTPVARGVIRADPADFIVEEEPKETPSGTGVHVWLQIRKRDCNTHWVAQSLARLAGVREVDVGFAGRKDRHALTTQWFSVRVDPKSEPDWHALASDRIEILAVERHTRKLRRGALRGNRFAITVREIEGDAAAIGQALERIARTGVPNYFGPQRFGIGGGNLVEAWRCARGESALPRRGRRDWILSAARAWLFNEVLSLRVAGGTWNQVLPGDVVMLDGTHSIFSVPEPDAEIHARAARFDLHPAGPLWGRGEAGTTGAPAAMEGAVSERAEVLCDWLERCGLKMQRRAFRVRAAELAWERIDARTIRVSFALPAGAFATSVLGEWVRFAD